MKLGTLTPSFRLGSATPSRIYLGSNLVWESFDADAAAYFARIVAAGSTISAGNQAAVNTFIVGCKADGIWSAIKASCILAGAETLAGALVPLVGAAPTNIGGLFVSGDYSRTTGLKGDGSTKYLNSNRNNNADPPSSHHFVAWATTASASGVIIGGGGGSIGASFISRAAAASWPFRSRISEFNVPSQGSRSTSSISGFTGMSRTTGANFTSRISASDQTITSTSMTSTADASFVFARSSGGSPNNYCADRLSFYSIGESLNLALLDARLATLMSSLT